MNKTVDRETIIKTLSKKLKGNAHVHALWLEGADAHDRVDEYADIDVWLDVDDEYTEEAFKEVEAILTTIALVESEDRFEHSHPQIEQKCYHLEGASEFLVIDVCIQKHSRKFWFRHGFEDEKAKVLFDKNDVVRFKEMDRKEVEKELRQRITDLNHAFHFYRFRVNKEIKRDHFLDALVYYHKYVMHPLIEVLRIKHQPTKRDFYLKHISIDLPSKVVSRFEELFKVTSLQELEDAMRQADEWFEEVTSELDEKQYLLPVQ